MAAFYGYPRAGRRLEKIPTTPLKVRAVLARSEQVLYDTLPRRTAGGTSRADPSFYHRLTALKIPGEDTVLRGKQVSEWNLWRVMELARVPGRLIRLARVWDGDWEITYRI